MSSTSQPVTQTELDLLVEGELSRKERRSLMKRLSQETDGWKRCATAFLEAQALSQSIQGLVQQGLIDSGSASRPPKPSPRSDSLPGRVGLRVVAGLAATLLICLSFYVGRQSAPQLSNSKLASVEQTQPDFANKAEIELEQQMMREVSLRLASVQLPDTQIVAIADLKTADATRFVPIIRNAHLEQQLAFLPQPRVPDYLDRNLERSGWKVKVQRQLLSVNAPDGHRQIFPIDSVDYHYVGRQTF